MPHPATTLWLIRHAEVAERYHNIFGGRIDMELSPRGHKQAASLARYLQPVTLDVLYSSPMQRVQQTLAPLLRKKSIKPRILDGLREVDFGDWTGLSWDGVQAKYGISAFAWLDQLELAAIPNAESAASFRARVEPCLREILGSHPGQQIAIACHGGVIRMLMAILLDWPLPKMAPFEIEYASVTQMIWRPSGAARLQLINFTPWRDLPAGPSEHELLPHVNPQSKL